MTNHGVAALIVLAAVATACSGSRPQDSGSGGAPGTGGRGGGAGAVDSGMDGAADGPPSCLGTNPAERCQSRPDECVPSACGCSFGVWTCTGDCRSVRLCADAAVDQASDASTRDAGADVTSDARADVGAATLCTSTGGTVQAILCCLNTVDFPSTCGVGACSCAPSSSHNVSACTCPSGTCFTQDRGCSAAVCTPGKDQTCNDSPVVSSFRGRCQADSTCVCMPDSALNPATGRCL